MIKAFGAPIEETDAKIHCRLSEEKLRKLILSRSAQGP